GPGDDYELLVRRCSAFVGVSATAPVIENGTERLGFGHPPFSRDEIDQINAKTRRSEEHTSELQSRRDLVCRLLLEKKKKKNQFPPGHTLRGAHPHDDRRVQQQPAGPLSPDVGEVPQLMFREPLDRLDRLSPAAAHV